MTKTRLFFDIEKEIQWLNQMATKGYRFIGKSCCTYEFEECECNAYVYQIDKRSIFDIKEDDKYINFLNELEIKLVVEQWGWYYFEKSNNGKPFELYTDIDSRIKYYMRILPVLAFIALINISIINSHLTEPSGPWVLNISVSYVSNIIILIAIIMVCIKYTKRIIHLKRQLNIDEM